MDNALAHTYHRGFTLIELIIVMMIIGIMAAVGATRFFGLVMYHRAESAAQRVKVDLQLARRRAKISSASQEIQFDPVSHSYTLLGVPHLDHPHSDYQVELERAPYQVSMVSADFGGDALLIFDGYGTPDSGGTVVVQAGQYQKIISVDPDTGKASIQ